MAGRAPLPCGPPTGSSELPRHPVHSCGRHHPGVQPCAITRSGRSLDPEGWGQGQAQHTLQPEGLGLRAQSGTLYTQLQPAGRAPVCPRPTLRAPVNPPPSRPPTHSPSHCTRPPPLVRPHLPAPPRPPPPAHTAPSRVHQLSSEVPATWGQVSSRRYLHPRRWQRPRPVCLESPLWSLLGEQAGGRGPLATLALTRGWVG